MRTVLLKEMMENLKSFRFITLLLISIVLFTTGSLIFAKRYSLHLQAHYDRIANASAPQNKEDQPFDTHGAQSYPRPSTVYTEIYTDPSPLLFVAEGGDKYRPYGYRIKPGGTREPLPAKSRNYAMPDVPEIDWSFIISVVFSLFIVLLGYNTLSGEKESGTMRLTLSNSVSRIGVLMAKYCAVMLTVSIPLLIGIIISLLVSLVYIPHIFSLNIVLRLILLLIVAFMFLSLFTFLSIGISAIGRQSSLVLMVLLGVWVVCIVLPNVSGVISEEIAKVPSEYEISMQEKNVTKETVANMMKYYLDMSSPDFKGFFPSVEAAQKDMVTLYTNFYQSLRNIEMNYDNTMKNRARTAQRLSKISPIALFRSISENFAGTGILQENRFISDVHAYSRTYDDYILGKVGELIVTPSISWGLAAWVNDGENISSQHIPAPEPQEYEGNKSDFSRFSNKTNSIIRIIDDSFVDMAVLLIWNLILAMGAFIAFNNADVR